MDDSPVVPHARHKSARTAIKRRIVSSPEPENAVEVGILDAAGEHVGPVAKRARLDTEEKDTEDHEHNNVNGAAHHTNTVSAPHSHTQDTKDRDKKKRKKKKRKQSITTPSTPQDARDGDDADVTRGVANEQAGHSPEASSYRSSTQRTSMSATTSPAPPSAGATERNKYVDKSVGPETTSVCDLHLPLASR